MAANSACLINTFFSLFSRPPRCWRIWTWVYEHWVVIFSKLVLIWSVISILFGEVCCLWSAKSAQYFFLSITINKQHPDAFNINLAVMLFQQSWKTIWIPTVFTASEEYYCYKIVANVWRPANKNKQPVKCNKATWLHADPKTKQTFQSDSLAVGTRSQKHNTHNQL